LQYSLLWITSRSRRQSAIGNRQAASGNQLNLRNLRMDSAFDRQAFDAHDLQRVRCRAGAGVQLIIEHHPAITYVLPKMEVCDPRALVGQLRQLKIVRRDDSQRVFLLRQSANESPTANMSFEIVCTSEDLVDKKHDRQRIVFFNRRKQ